MYNDLSLSHVLIQFSLTSLNSISSIPHITWCNYDVQRRVVLRLPPDVLIVIRLSREGYWVCTGMTHAYLTVLMSSETVSSYKSLLYSIGYPIGNGLYWFWINNLMSCYTLLAVFVVDRKTCHKYRR